MERELEADLGLLSELGNGSASVVGRCWQSPYPVVVTGRHGPVSDIIIEETCRRDDIGVVRRCSGGGAVVIGPGCLNYAVAVSLDSWPDLSDVAVSFRIVLQAIVQALAVPDLSIAGETDLALKGRKVSGNAQHRTRRAILQHGTLLYGFDPALATRYLREPVRRPAYRADRSHEEFLGNIPLPAHAIRHRLEVAWRRLGENRGTDARRDRRGSHDV